MNNNTSIQSLSETVIVNNWSMYNKLLASIVHRFENIEKMLNVIGDELAVAPASSKTEFHNAFPGGLVDHSLRVLKNAMNYTNTIKADVPKESLIIASLFHDLGKVGDGTNPLYVKQTDQWRRDKLGEVYTHNQDLVYMTTGLRGLFLLQKFDIKLTQEEYLAIYLNDGWILQENKQYALKEPILAHIIQTADYTATLTEKRGQL
jgi:hypothetical protein